MKRFLLAPVMLIGRILFELAEMFKFNYGRLNPYIFGMMMGSFPHKKKENPDGPNTPRAIVTPAPVVAINTERR